MVSGLKLFDLSGKTTLITGSSQGIGYALAKGLAEAGSDIILNGRNIEKLRKSAELINTKQKIFQLCFDVTDYVQSKQTIDNFEQEITSIDILINALNQVSKDYVKIDELIIGGENSDWILEDHPDIIFNK